MARLCGLSQLQSALQARNEGIFPDSCNVAGISLLDCALSVAMGRLEDGEVEPVSPESPGSPAEDVTEEHPEHAGEASNALATGIMQVLHPTTGTVLRC